MESQDVEMEFETDQLVSGLDFDELFNLEKKSKPQPTIYNLDNSDNRLRAQILSHLCGRWIVGSNRCGVEISRKGEHFILTYLKRNGNLSDERYILLWNYGDICYYGQSDRITVLALNTESDTLMISPGVDYTRVPEEGKIK